MRFDERKMARKPYEIGIRDLSLSEKLLASFFVKVKIVCVIQDGSEIKFAETNMIDRKPKCVRRPCQ